MKTIKITVTTTTGTHELIISVPVTSSNPNGIPTSAQWDQILAFEDEHVGGRPKDR